MHYAFENWSMKFVSRPMIPNKLHSRGDFELISRRYRFTCCLAEGNGVHCAFEQWSVKFVLRLLIPNRLYRRDNLELTLSPAIVTC
jgi:hypothetical protein